MATYQLKELKIEVTNACPLVCIQLIEEAFALGVRQIAFSGGEPLIHEGIVEMTKVASYHGIHTSIYTTGNIPQIENRLLELKSSGLNLMVFSIYSHNAKEHELITRKSGSFKRTLFAIKSALLLGIECEIHFVALKRNFSNLKYVVELADNLGVKKISVLRFVPQGRGQLIYNETLTKIEFLELRRSISELRKQSKNIRTGSPFNFLFLNEKPNCNSGLDRLLIDTELNISPCDAFKQISPDEIVNNPMYSNLRDHSLEKCWSDSTYLSAIRSHLESGYDDTCSECNDLGRCLSGCLAQKVILLGGLTKTPDPSCLKQ
jgi:radical SAM protein with 4Fe4S-binding SPASM domain